MSRLALIKKAFLEIILASTCHGIPSFFRTRRIIQKILWFICTIGSCGVCAFYVYNIIFNFFQYQVVTNIETVYEQPTLYPTISICSTDKSFNNKNLKSLIQSCVFNYESACVNNTDQYFEQFRDSDYDTCYRFNSGKYTPLFYSNIGGMDDSLQLSVYTTTGLAIWIHNASSPPKREFMNNHNGEINFAPASFLTHIIVEKIFDEKLGDPYNSCLVNVDEFSQNKTIINYIKNSNYTYNREYCLELCFDIFYIQNNTCNCTNMTLGQVWQDCYIGKSLNQINPSIRDCTLKKKIQFYKKSVSDLCSIYCPIECNTVSYTVSTKSVLSNKSNYSNIFVYYRSLKYTLISQQASMSPFDLVSNIGGILGLFVGVSFLSFIEIVEFLTEVLFILFTRPKTNIEIIKKSHF